MVSKRKYVQMTAAALVVSSLAFPSAMFAEGTGDNPVFTEDIKTAEQEKAAKDKEAKAKDHFEKKAKTIEQGVTVDATYNTISVTPYKQETSYWCGPATTKQVLQYINGTSSSQSTYASLLGTTTDGTDFSRIDDVLNSKQSKNNYVYRSFASTEKATFKADIVWGIDNKYPPVLDLKISPTYMPKYTSSVAGHILSASGYDYSDNTVRLTDPYDQGGRGVTYGNVWHPWDGVWQANQAHFRKAIIW